MKNLPVAIPETAQGRIITSVGGLYTVETFSGICTCKARGIFRKRGITPYVGDYVQLSEDGVIQEILPRKNSILRPPVSNLDQIFFVVSTCHPAPNLLLLDSFLTVAIYQDIQPAVVLTKMDLHRGEQLEKLYTDAGIPVYPVEYNKPETVAAVSELLAGKISMMTGNSGVGKSTLLNAIDPSLQIATGEISEKLGRGKHTTRQVQLYPCAGGYLADTPGFSAVDLEKFQTILKDELADCFREMHDYEGKCRFRGCSHTKEAGCAVLQAVKDGEISQSRHQSYLNLYEQAKNIKEWELDR